MARQLSHSKVTAEKNYRALEAADRANAFEAVGTVMGIVLIPWEGPLQSKETKVYIGGGKIVEGVLQGEHRAEEGTKKRGNHAYFPKISAISGSVLQGHLRQDQEFLPL